MKSDIISSMILQKLGYNGCMRTFFCVNSDGLLPSECQFPLLLPGGLISTSWKCSVHHSSGSFFFVVNSFSLFYLNYDTPPPLPVFSLNSLHTRLVILYTLPCPAPITASSAPASSWPMAFSFVKARKLRIPDFHVGLTIIQSCITCTRRELVWSIFFVSFPSFFNSIKSFLLCGVSNSLNTVRFFQI